MFVLSGNVGDIGRPPEPGKGGGVNDSARGLLWAEVIGERTGDEAPIGGRHPAVMASDSSSDPPLDSSSFRSDDTKGGSSFASRDDAPFRTGDVCPFVWPTPLVPWAAAEELAMAAAAAGDDTEVDPSLCVGNRRVRGLLSFLSGSWTGSAGEAVTERVFRLRPALLLWPPFSSISLARSKAIHACRSSSVS